MRPLPGTEFDPQVESKGFQALLVHGHTNPSFLFGYKTPPEETERTRYTIVCCEAKKGAIIYRA